MLTIEDLLKAAEPVYRRGMDHPNAKLDDDKVRMIREANRRGASISGIARAMGVSRRSILMVIAGKTWKHVV